MKKQKICIIGDGLSGLSAALILSKLDVEVDLVIKKNDKIIAILISFFPFFYFSPDHFFSP